MVNVVTVFSKHVAMVATEFKGMLMSSFSEEIFINGEQAREICQNICSVVGRNLENQLLKSGFHLRSLLTEEHIRHSASIHHYRALIVTTAKANIIVSLFKLLTGLFDDDEVRKKINYISEVRAKIIEERNSNIPAEYDSAAFNSLILPSIDVAHLNQQRFFVIVEYIKKALLKLVGYNDYKIDFSDFELYNPELPVEIKESLPSQAYLLLLEEIKVRVDYLFRITRIQEKAANVPVYYSATDLLETVDVYDWQIFNFVSIHQIAITLLPITWRSEDKAIKKMRKLVFKKLDGALFVSVTNWVKIVSLLETQKEIKSYLESLKTSVPRNKISIFRSPVFSRKEKKNKLKSNVDLTSTMVSSEHFTKQERRKKSLSTSDLFEFNKMGTETSAPISESAEKIEGTQHHLSRRRSSSDSDVPSSMHSLSSIALGQEITDGTVSDENSTSEQMPSQNIAYPFSKRAANDTSQFYQSEASDQHISDTSLLDTLSISGILFLVSQNVEAAIALLSEGAVELRSRMGNATTLALLLLCIAHNNDSLIRLINGSLGYRKKLEKNGLLIFLKDTSILREAWPDRIFSLIKCCANRVVGLEVLTELVDALEKLAQALVLENHGKKLLHSYLSDKKLLTQTNKQRLMENILHHDSPIILSALAQQMDLQYVFSYCSQEAVQNRIAKVSQEEISVLLCTEPRLFCTFPHFFLDYTVPLLAQLSQDLEFARQVVAMRGEWLEFRNTLFHHDKEAFLRAVFSHQDPELIKSICSVLSMKKKATHLGLLLEEEISTRTNAPTNRK